jgi:hypothetical protein
LLELPYTSSCPLYDAIGYLYFWTTIIDGKMPQGRVFEDTLLSVESALYQNHNNFFLITFQVKYFKDSL